MEKKKLYSCYCLFDVCCLGKVKNESFQELGARVIKHMSVSSKRLLGKGLCKCGLCKPVRFHAGSTWLLSTVLPETDYEIMYVVCREHLERQIDQLTLDICQQMRANEVCEAKEVLKHKYHGYYPSCFNFYQEDLIIIRDICKNCKIFFAALPEFNFKKL